MRAGDAVAGLSVLATDDDAAVRKAAVWALGQIRDVSARSVVEAATHDSDRFVRDAATTALRRM
jgi:HEAT repeat protein